MKDAQCPKFEIQNAAANSRRILSENLEAINFDLLKTSNF